MAKQETNKALALPLKAENYPVLSRDFSQVEAVIKANLQGDSLSLFDLQTFGVSAGGTPAFKVTKPDGSTDVAKEVIAVIVHHTTRRAFWEKGMDEGGGGTPPDCFSKDSIRGEGKIASSPGHSGLCKSCPKSQFGSAVRKGQPTKGQACAQRKILFLMFPESVFPSVMNLPPTSIADFRAYASALIQDVLPLHGVLTKITLSTTAISGQNVAVAKFAKLGELDVESTERLAKMGAMFANIFDAVPPTLEEMVGGDPVQPTVNGQPAAPSTETPANAAPAQADPGAAARRVEPGKAAGRVVVDEKAGK